MIHLKLTRRAPGVQARKAEWGARRKRTPRSAHRGRIRRTGCVPESSSGSSSASDGEAYSRHELPRPVLEALSIASVIDSRKAEVVAAVEDDLESAQEDTEIRSEHAANVYGPCFEVYVPSVQSIEAESP